MKSKGIYLIVGFISFGCSNSSVKPTRTHQPDVVLNSDSIQSLQKAIVSAKQDRNTAADSLELYHLTEFNDTCIKYLYTIYHDGYIERGKLKLMLSQCTISPIRITRINKTVFRFDYTAFLYDSIPGNPQLDSIFSGWESFPMSVRFDTSAKKPIGFYQGFYQYGNAKAFHKWYQESLESQTFRNFVTTDSNNFSPLFKRLFNL